MECILTKPDKNRKTYIPKGYGKLIAILLSSAFLILIPYFAPLFWPAHIEHEKSFYFYYLIIVHSGIFILCNVTMYFIYKLEIDFFERYKVHDYEWPWNVNKSEWVKFLKKSILVIAFNQFVCTPFVLIISQYFQKENIVRTDYESLPSLFEALIQIAFFIICEDFGTYWGHRIFHWNVIYPYIHKIHHQYKNTISISSEYAHPIEFLGVNIIPTNLGMLILQRRTHLLTLSMWIIIRIVKTTEAHSGYQFSWSPFKLLPYQIPSDYHNFHHSSGFNSNYGSFFLFWDSICGTTHPDYNKQYKKDKEVKEDKEDKEVDDVKRNN